MVETTIMNNPSSEEAVFAEALKKPTPEARTEFLRVVCGDNAAFRQRIEALLRAVEDAGQFLEQPPTTLTHSTAVVPVTEKPGDKIGRYKLREQIGEGGCGVVYVADQEEPIIARWLGRDCR